MIFHSFIISFFFGIIVPGVLILLFPDTLWHDITKGYFSNGAIIYLSVLFIFFTLSFFFSRRGEVGFLKRALCSENIMFIKIRSGLILIVLLYLARILYALASGNISPYINLANEVDLLNVGFFNKIVNYLFFTLHKFYPLILGFIILSLPKKWVKFVFALEIIYGLFIFSKMIIVINIIAMTIIYFNYKHFEKRRDMVLRLIFIGLFSIVIFYFLKEIFGILRVDNATIDINYNFIEATLSNGYSRFQTITSIFYVDRVMSDFLYGKSLCHVVSNFVPDSLISTPLSCRNIDEPILIHYYSLSQNTTALIDKDIFSFYGEPYANFGVYGILLFVVLIVADRLFLKILGDNKFGLLYAWIVLINILIYHNSWSTIFGNIYISFIVIRIAQLFVYRFNKMKALE